MRLDQGNSGGSPSAEKVTPASEDAGAKLILDGRDNYGKPRQNFADRLAAMDDAAFMKEAEQSIWLSAYAANNPRSDYHWHADACYDEAKRRGNPDLYVRAHRRASGTM